MNGRRPREANAGHSIYTSRFLGVYDLLVLGWFSNTAWRCRAAVLTGHYDAHVTANHLDVGVGTGYFLDHCTFPTPRPRVALMDINPACLAAASRRVQRFRPEVYTADVLEPVGAQIGGEVAGFDSIGMTYLVHCLPGNISEKSWVFENLLTLARPGATLFGATLLHDGVDRNWYARRVMAFNNRRGIFSNTDDDLSGLESVLREHLDESAVRVVGCVALFSGTARR